MTLHTPPIEAETVSELAQPSRLASLLRRGLGLVGINGSNNVFEQGVQHGDAHGEPHGEPHGSHHGVHKGLPNGFSKGTMHGERHGDAHAGAHPKLDTASIEQELGLKFHLIGGFVLALEPDQEPLPSPGAHAEAFLRWLQEQPLFPGNEVSARLLQHELYPRFAEYTRCTVYCWSTIARRLARLPGVEKRQVDCRGGSERQGYSPVVYRIPARQLSETSAQ